MYFQGRKGSEQIVDLQASAVRSGLETWVGLSSGRSILKTASAGPTATKIRAGQTTTRPRRIKRREESASQQEPSTTLKPSPHRRKIKKQTLLRQPNNG